ncbi:MAG: alcohol dehydrogenase catalytic domain-containing protein [Streptosporangiales bacterium]|nr:alcohol dehydrogenase catalytic domain-containing protein [Streptosporangiales bacterium]
MRAVVWHGTRDVGVETVADPRIEEPTDAVIQVTRSGICGSDLHLYDHGSTMAMRDGDILGHEAAGIVVETGSEVPNLERGDRVSVPFNISCGHCFMCRRGLFSQCETTRAMGERKGASLFGYTHMYGGVPGAQAEYLRVPQAHFGPIVLDDAISDEAAMLLADVLPTAWQAVDYADVPIGGTLAVYGLGPVGQMCVRVARHRGIDRVIGLDPYPDRRRAADEHGAVSVDVTAADPVEVIRDATQGRGADGVIDAVGMDAEGSTADRALQATRLRPDRIAALEQALGSVRRGGTVSVIGVYAGWMGRFPVGDLFDRQVTLRWGQANVRRWTADILDALRASPPLDVTGLVTHAPPLDEAPEWYEHFRDKDPGVVKVGLTPR